MAAKSVGATAQVNVKVVEQEKNYKSEMEKIAEKTAKAHARIESPRVQAWDLHKMTFNLNLDSNE
jgi:hypothetical protein